MDDGSIEFEVESILKHRVRKYGRGSRLEYLIHWKGYDTHDDTWEPLANLTNCDEMLQQYNEVFRDPVALPPLHLVHLIMVQPMD